MRKSQFIFVLMLSASFATMARADDTSYANCLKAAGEGKCEQIGTSGTYYALSGDEGNKTMTIYGTKESGSTAATVPQEAFFFWDDENEMSTVPAGVTSLKTSGNVDIGELAFAVATGLTSVDLTGVKTIGYGAFNGATNLTSVDLTGVQSIGGEAFKGATGLKSANLTGVQSIGDSAFWYATGLTSVDLTGVQTIGHHAFWMAEGLTGHLDLTGVQSIGAYAFEGATNLTSVDLTGVKTIGDGAFQLATGLTSVDLTGVQTIGYGAFSAAVNLTSVVISDSLLDSNGNILEYDERDGVYTGIDLSAFSDSGLNTIYCPADKTCGNSFWGLSDTLEIISYSKNDDGTYSVGENMYANADMMTKNIACENADQCAALQTAFNAGNTCATQDACNTLAAEYATPQPTKPQRADIRIYTIDEANAVAGKVNRVSIKYR